ncbi:DUF6607 family protein [Luteimonas salinilitoris]|uniref:DUF6607 family protein n=1 Tax=Luteimonas salinilitoris TaxID=3237697 RepID=A0ABV4HV17_9GAMM
MTPANVFSLATALSLSLACAAAAAEPTPQPDPQRDRTAILAMQGEYDVDFSFDETVILAPDYERAPAKRSGASEVVIVVEDSPARVVLQHILVDPKSGHVTKHWRQDWMYEAPRRFEFSADQTWHVRDIPAEATRGAWTQCVYEVSDAPRYCGTGRWNHGYGVSTWTSDRSWRPLPRREYTTREDYNALNVENRHTIVPGGWTHEQDNTKTVRDADGGSRTLVREFGFNDYRKGSDTDFTPAYDYWTATRDYWAKVRSRWDALLSQPPGLRLKTEIDGMALIIPLFEQAQRVQDGDTVADAEIDAAFAEWVEAAPADPVRAH